MSTCDPSGLPFPGPSEPPEDPNFVPPSTPPQAFGPPPDGIEPGTFDVNFHGDVHDRHDPCGTVEVSSDGNSLGFALGGTATPDYDHTWDEGDQAYIEDGPFDPPPYRLKRQFFAHPTDPDIVYMYTTRIDSSGGVVPGTEGVWATLTRRNQ
jgi:hypothetical protein